MNAIDIGGSKLNRQYWPNYFSKAKAIIYVIDCADKAKMEENGLVIEKLLSTPELFEKPFWFSPTSRTYLRRHLHRKCQRVSTST